VVEPSTQDLPFVLVYGPWIGKLGLVMLVAIVLALVTALRRLVERRRVRDVLSRMEQHDLDHVIRGTLGGGSAATLFVSAPHADSQRACWRSDALWVETADGRVALEGEIVVEAGTQGEATRRRRLPDMPEALRERAEELPLVGTRNWSVTRLLRVTAGDEVYVRGKLVNVPGQQESTFREAPLALRMTATASDPIVLAARKPRRVMPMMAPFRIALLAVATMFVGYKVGHAVGDRVRDDCWNAKRYQHVQGFVELDGSDRCIRIAVLPGQQKRVYGTLFSALEDHPHRDERSLARLAYLADHSGYEGSFLYLLDNTGRMEDLLKFARRWREPRREQDALYALGRYDEAIAVKGGEEPSLDALIAAGRWREAARSVAETARYFESQKHDDPDTGRVYAIAARQKRCLQLLFEHYAGDSTSWHQLHVRAADDPEHVCLPMVIESEPPAEREKRFAELDIWKERYDVARIVEAQAFLDGNERFDAPASREEPELTLVELDETVRSDGIKATWLARLAPEPKAPERRIHWLQWRVVARVLDGATADAAHLAEEVDHVGALRATVAMYTPSIDDTLNTWVASAKPIREEHRRLFLRAGRDVANFRLGHDTRYREALVAAQQGDGTLLANIVATERWWNLGDVLAVWPRVEQGRELLRERLVWNAQYGSWRSHSPFDLASTAATRRDLFRLTGDTALAAYWDGVYQRVAKTFDRKRLIALLLAE
jgi:hypothetical protein